MTDTYIARKIQLIAKADTAQTTFKVEQFEVITEFDANPKRIIIENVGIIEFIIVLDEALIPVSIGDSRTRRLIPKYKFIDWVLSKVVSRLYVTDAPLSFAQLLETKDEVLDGMFTIGLARVGQRIKDSGVKEMDFGDKTISFDFIGPEKKIEIRDDNELILRVYLNQDGKPNVVDYRLDDFPPAQEVLDSMMLSVVCRVEMAPRDMDSNIFPHPNGENNEALLASPEQRPD